MVSATLLMDKKYDDVKVRVNDVCEFQDARGKDTGVRKIFMRFQNYHK